MKKMAPEFRAIIPGEVLLLLIFHAAPNQKIRSEGSWQRKYQRAFGGFFAGTQSPLVKRRPNKEKPDPGNSRGKGACIKLSPKNCLQIIPVSQLMIICILINLFR